MRKQSRSLFSRIGGECLEDRLALSTVLGGYITTSAGDKIPDFGANPTVKSIADGNWSSPAVWSTGAVPGAGDIVDVGNAVTYDVSSSSDLNTIEVLSGGTLTFATNVNTLVVVANFVVLEGGTLQIGTAANPVAANVTANIEFSDTLLDTTTDPQQFGNGLIGLGTVTMHGATLSDSFVALASEPKAGDATLSLSQPVTGWKAGDLLVLPDTRELTYQERMSKYVPQWEQLTIASVSADGKRLALTAPLHFDHLGARDATGALRYLPHVGDLTRNVNLMSVNPAGNRGWVMFTDRANVDIQDVAFEGTGRTQLAAIDDTTFDASGNVTHMGTNQDDRNPVTFRNLNGPATAQANGYQYMFRGNSVYCPMSAAPTAIWGINVDNSHYGLIQDNFVYAWAGAGIVTQTGAETGNVFDHNFVVRIPGTGARVDDAGTAGDGFWFRGVTNTVTNNVVANAYSVRDFYSYGYDVYAYFLGKVTIPAAQGDDPTLPGQSLTIDGNAQPLGTFFGDVAYGVPSGMTFWWISAYYKSPDGTSPSTIKDFTVWHQWEWGIFAYESSNVTLDGYVDLGDFGLPSLPDLATGIWFSDYVTRGFTITNADIEGQIEGVLLPQAADGVTIVKNSHFANLVDVDDPTTFSTDQPILLPAKSADLANDQFDPWPGRPLTAVQMEWSLNQNRNAIQLDTLFVHNYDNVPGDSFQVFYGDQVASFIVPQTGSQPGLIASPVAGLTNAQNWATYGIAIAGAVAPNNATTRSGINGLVASLTNPAPSAPTNLAAMGAIGQIVLSWTASANAASYNVYRGTTPGGETLLASGVTGTAYTDAGIAGSYFYQVTAVDSAGESGKSNEATATATATVDTPVVAAGSAAFTAIEQSLSPVQTVATFADGAGSDAAYTSTIAWGDGGSSAGTIALNAATGLYSVSGQHLYVAAGPETITVTIGDDNAPVVVVTDPVTVNSQLTATLAGKYVTAAYQSVLGRTPTANELNGAYAALTTGTETRSTFAIGLVNSVEYLSDIVRADYAKFLGRAADADGLAFWVGKMQAGETDEWLEAAFAGSAEYYQHAGGTDLSWVDQMYLDVLGRAADSAGEHSWVAYLAAGGSRADVAHGFAVSPERETEHIQANYQSYLHRSSDALGLVFWLDQFEANGMTNETMIAGFVASDEYYKANS